MPNSTPFWTRPVWDCLLPAAIRDLDYEKLVVEGEESSTVKSSLGEESTVSSTDKESESESSTTSMDEESGSTDDTTVRNTSWSSAIFSTLFGGGGGGGLPPNAKGGSSDAKVQQFGPAYFASRGLPQPPSQSEEDALSQIEEEQDEHFLPRPPSLVDRLNR